MASSTSCGIHPYGKSPVCFRCKMKKTCKNTRINEKKKRKRWHNCINKLWWDESSSWKMTANQKNKLLERQNQTALVAVCCYFQKYWNDWRLQKWHRSIPTKRNSSGKDTRKENEKATKPAREKAYQSVLFELRFSLLHYFSAVYLIEGYVRNTIVRWLSWGVLGELIAQRHHTSYSPMTASKQALWVSRQQKGVKPGSHYSSRSAPLPCWVKQVIARLREWRKDWL